MEKNKQNRPTKSKIIPKLKANVERYSNTKETLETLRRAIETAESSLYPNRYNLLQIYHTITKDPHLTALINHRKERIKGLSYSLIKTTVDRIEPKSTQIFSQYWFKNFLDYTLDAIFFGNSLVEVYAAQGEDPDAVSLNLIPREFVIPEAGQIKLSPEQQTGEISYLEAPYDTLTLDISQNLDPKALGALLPVAKYVLFKNEALLNWSQYTEIFGQPLRVATTDSDDIDELDSIASFLANLGRSGYMIKNSSTSVEFLGSDSKGSTTELYADFVDYLDKQVSKAIVGGTMLTDEGSSRSQAEVHERGSLIFTKADMRFVETVINRLLIPKLQNLGIITEKNLLFRFEEPDLATIEEKILIDTFLLEHFEILDRNYFQKRYGVSLRPKNPTELKKAVATDK